MRVLRAVAALLLCGVAWLQAGPVVAQAPDWSLQAQRRLQGGPGIDSPARMAERQRLLDEGEALLAADDTEGAQQAFDRAALLLHAADTELALVRSYMQGGEYRRALSFGAHAAGAHRELPAAGALYAWLLQAGGQGVAATRLLDAALLAAPADAALRTAQTQLRTAWPEPGAGLLEPPLRMRPYASVTAVPATASRSGSAVLTGDGQHAYVPLTALAGATGIWLRNGLGQTVAARLLRQDAEVGVGLLRLDKPLALAHGLHTVPRLPFAGSPASMVEYGSGEGAEPAWPWLRLGFFGRPGTTSEVRALGIDAPSGPRGGPVFDAAGRLAGIALHAADGREQLLSSALLATRLGTPLAPDPEAANAERVEPDAVYERALRVALQVLVTR